MSVSSNSRKESTDSYASQQMQNGGDMTGMDQLHRFNQPEGRVGAVEGTPENDTDFSDDAAEITDLVAAEEETTTDIYPSVSSSGSGADSIGETHTQPTTIHVIDADWNTTTEDGGTSAGRVDKSGQTLGHS